MTATHAREQRLDPALPAPAGYGSAAYFEALDAGAPRVDARALHAGPIEPAPYISHLYPIGYYALAAFAIELADRAKPGSVVAEFRFARFLSVVLLIPALAFSWLALRELGIGDGRALAVFACTALLPLTAWMGGSVAPDNLAAALLAPIAYVALRLRRKPDAPVLGGLLGALLAALAATKQQYFLAAFVPIVAMLVLRLPVLRSAATLRTLATTAVPPLIALGVTVPMVWALPGGSGVCHLAAPVAGVHGAGPIALFYLRGLGLTLQSMVLPGAPLGSFWLAFTAYRNDQIVLGTAPLSNLATVYISIVSVVLAALFALRVARIWPRIARVARRRSWRSAGRVLTSNVLVNTYLCYFAILCGFETTIGGYIPVQGRYWLPVVSGLWLCAATIAPRALPRTWGRALSAVIFTLVLGFGVTASAFAFPTLHARFYEPGTRVEPAKELLVEVSSQRVGGDFRISGAAIDLRDASPAERVVLRLDRNVLLRTKVVPRPDVLCDMEGTLLRTGFEATVPSKIVRGGAHRLSVLVQTRWSRGLVDSGAYATLAAK